MAKKIGFIGLGTMGMPMAVNLLKNEYTLFVYNRTKDKALELQTLGATVASSPAQVAREADVVFTMVSNDQALLDIVFGAEGLLEGVRPGMTIIDCSTVAPETSRKVYAELGAHFADYLDAPVTGSKPAAESGSLTFMVGGREEVYKEQEDLFEVLGKGSLYLGESGSGSYAKLAHNTIVGINLVGFVEGLSIAAKSGIDPEKFLEIVASGGGNSRQAELKGPKVINRDFSNQFSTALMLKDLQLAQRLTAGIQLPTPMLNAAASVFQMGLAKGLADEDLSSVIQCYEEWMKLTVAKAEPSAEETKPQAEALERRRANRISLGIKLHLSVYQWQQEGSFSGQNIEGTLHDLSESGLQIISHAPLAQDMFIVIHFPQEALLPPITGKIIRIEAKEGAFRYGCMLSGLPPYTRIKLEDYIARHKQE